MVAKHFYRIFRKAGAVKNEQGILVIEQKRGLVVRDLYEACKSLAHTENENKDFISVKLPKRIPVTLKYKFDAGYRMIPVDIEEMWVDLLYQEVTFFDRNPKDGALFEWSSNRTALASLRNLVDAIRLYKYL